MLLLIIGDHPQVRCLFRFLDCYDPTQEDTLDLLGYRADPTLGLAYRVMQFEYKGDLGEILLFRLFSPD